jgi:hypothetical protein
MRCLDAGGDVDPTMNNTSTSSSSGHGYAVLARTLREWEEFVCEGAGALGAHCHGPGVGPSDVPGTRNLPGRYDPWGMGEYEREYVTDLNRYIRTGGTKDPFASSLAITNSKAKTQGLQDSSTSLSLPNPMRERAVARGWLSMIERDPSLGLMTELDAATAIASMAMYCGAVEHAADRESVTLLEHCNDDANAWSKTTDDLLKRSNLGISRRRAIQFPPVTKTGGSANTSSSSTGGASSSSNGVVVELELPESQPERDLDRLRSSIVSEPISSRTTRSNKRGEDMNEKEEEFGGNGQEQDQGCEETEEDEERLEEHNYTDDFDSGYFGMDNLVHDESLLILDRLRDLTTRSLHLQVKLRREQKRKRLALGGGAGGAGGVTIGEASIIAETRKANETLQWRLRQRERALAAAKDARETLALQLQVADKRAETAEKAKMDLEREVILNEIRTCIEWTES